MKRILKHLHETGVGDDSTMRIGSTIILHKNEEAWRGIVSEMRTLRNWKTVYYIKDAISISYSYPKYGSSGGFGKE
jgi:hypothetical protein